MLMEYMTSLLKKKVSALFMDENLQWFTWDANPSGWTWDRIEIITFAVSLHFVIQTMFYLSCPRFNVA